MRTFRKEDNELLKSILDAGDSKTFQVEYSVSLTKAQTSTNPLSILFVKNDKTLQRGGRGKIAKLRYFFL